MAAERSTVAGAGRLTVEAVGERLRRWVADQWIEGAIVDTVYPMPGNAGLSFGFQVRTREPVERRGFVLRLAPPGVRRQGNTDVLRQVPLLKALRRRGLPVPAVLWWTGDPRWFGTDAFVVSLLRGRPLHMTESEGSFEAGPGETARLLGHAAKLLARVHAQPWREDLPGWSEPRTADDEVSWWSHVLGRAHAPGLAAAGSEVARALTSTAPREGRIGLLHGDYQTNNILFEDGRITGLLDWELAGVGPQLLDLGWLAMMTDPACWDEGYAKRLRVTASLPDLVAAYEADGGSAERIEWYVALACFRFGVIVAFNSMLHRTGKRVDSLYELLEPSVPRLFARAREFAVA